MVRGYIVEQTTEPVLSDIVEEVKSNQYLPYLIWPWGQGTWGIEPSISCIVGGSFTLVPHLALSLNSKPFTGRLTTAGSLWTCDLGQFFLYNYEVKYAWNKKWFVVHYFAISAKNKETGAFLIP